MAADFALANVLNVEEQQMGMRLNRIQMNTARVQALRERIAMERELMAVDKEVYSEHPSLIGSPNDAKKRVAMRQEKMNNSELRPMVISATKIRSSYIWKVLTMRLTIPKKTEEEKVSTILLGME
ncbi:hypothetical protein Droror1_Dr00023467 [Drosera rotundifolia]